MALGVELDQFFKILMGMIVICISGIAYWLFGYAFAYGDGNDFIGLSNFALKGVPTTDYADFFFQYSFAASTATIVSGSVAERCEFVAYFLYSFCITGLIYPIATHWYWGGGFLAKGVDYGGDIGVVTYVDFAGSGLVHVIGGSAGFIGAAILGPRIGRFRKDPKLKDEIRGHSVPVAALGGFILFFGFLAFNGGSLGTISNKGDGAIISRVIVNTIVSASFGAFSSLLINRLPWFGSSYWSLLMTINGALTGMVSICAGANALYPWEAAIMGTFSGPVYHFTSYWVRKLSVDDPLDACAVHFGGGAWGVLSLAFLHKDEGIFFNWDNRSGMLLLWQIAGLLTIVTWTVVTSAILFGCMRLLGILRVPADTEIKGLDVPKHHEPAYPVEAYGHGHIEKLLSILQTSMANCKRKYGYVTLEDKGPYESPEVHAHSTN